MRAWLRPFPRVDLRVEGPWPYEADPVLGYVARAGARTRIVRPRAGTAFTIHTDARRLRVGAAGDRTPSRVALLVVGCSFAWGDGVEGRDTFAARLGSELGQPIANAALGGYGTLQSLLALERHAALRPRAVIYAFIEDHLRRNLSPCAPNYAPFCVPVPHVRIDAGGEAQLAPPPAQRFTLEHNRRFFEEVATRPGFGIADVLWRARVDLLGYATIAARAPRDDAAAREAALALLLPRMAEAAHAAGASLFVVHLPYLDGEPAAAPEALRRALPPEATLIDLAPAVAAHRARPGAAALAQEGDPHPSAAAHALFARTLAADARLAAALAAPRADEASAR